MLKQVQHNTFEAFRIGYASVSNIINVYFNHNFSQLEYDVEVADFNNVKQVGKTVGKLVEYVYLAGKFAYIPCFEPTAFQRF